MFIEILNFTKKYENGIQYTIGNRIVALDFRKASTSSNKVVKIIS